jgi:DNA helicase-2/ATP-dependent DNA helicase PcrA
LNYNEFLKEYDLTHLDAQQQEAVRATDGPILLLAVPGSGKTTTLIARLGYLVIGKGVSPETILTMTYTVAATGEMKDRFAKKFGSQYADKMNFKTINAVCASIIRSYEWYGHKAFKLVSDEGEISKILTGIWLNVCKKYPTESDIKELRMKITYVKNQMVPKKELDSVTVSSSDGTISIKELYEEYVRFMRDSSLMDFDDQLVFSYQILKKNPKILNRFQDKYQYICVDEAQDTSFIQHRIIQMLAEKSRNIFMVGDEDQSIYGFRAAYPKALLEFERTWKDAKVLFIETNYRSTPEIVGTSMDFIRQNKKRRDKKMKAFNPSGAKIDILWAKNRIQQFDMIADIAHDATEPVTFLYRNNDTALPIIDTLDRSGIPYKVRAVDSLFFTNIIYRDVMCIFRLALNPSDGEAFMQIYYKLGLYVKKAVAEEAVAMGGNILFGLKNQVGKYTKGKLDSIIADFKKIPNLAPANAIDLIYEMGYGDYLEQHGIDSFRLNIMRTLGVREKTIPQFIKRLEYLQKVIRAGSKTDNAKVLLSTIHSAKGLEYDNVVLVDVADGVFPSNSKDTDIEEEKRLFYVAMTRARKKLCIFAFREEESEFTEYVRSYLSNGSHVFSDNIRVGQKIKHRFFGTGVVTSIKGDALTARFENSKELKTMSLSYIIRNKIIKFAS